MGVTPAHLDGLLTEADDSDGATDAFDRLASAIEQPSRVDATVVDHLARVLAQQRTAEDILGPRLVLVPVLAEADLIERLARDARGPVRTQLVQLVAEYRQFAGWMGEDTGDHPAALLHYGRAMDAAQEVGDRNMITSVLSMKSHLAWSERDPAQAIGLDAAGRRDRAKVSPGVLAHTEAAELFEAARARLPEGYRRDHGRYVANLAIAAAHGGQVDRAVAAGLVSLAIAVETGSARIVTDLRRMRSALAEWDDSTGVREFDEALVNLSV